MKKMFSFAVYVMAAMAMALSLGACKKSNQDSLELNAQFQNDRLTNYELTNNTRDSSPSNNENIILIHNCISKLAQDNTYNDYYDFSTMQNYCFNDTTNSYVYVIQSRYFAHVYLTVLVEMFVIKGMFALCLPSDHSIEYYINNNDPVSVIAYTADFEDFFFSGHVNFTNNTFYLESLNPNLFNGKKPKKEIEGLICNLGIGSAGTIWAIAFGFVPVWGWAVSAVISLGTIVGSYYAC